MCGQSQHTLCLVGLVDAFIIVIQNLVLYIYLIMIFAEMMSCAYTIMFMVLYEVVTCWQTLK